MILSRNTGTGGSDQVTVVPITGHADYESKAKVKSKMYAPCNMHLAPRSLPLAPCLQFVSRLQIIPHNI